MMLFCTPKKCPFPPQGRPEVFFRAPRAPRRFFAAPQGSPKDFQCFFEVILVLCFLREKTKLGRPYKFIGALRFKGVGLSLNIGRPYKFIGALRFRGVGSFLNSLGRHRSPLQISLGAMGM